MGLNLIMRVLLCILGNGKRHNNKWYFSKGFVQLSCLRDHNPRPGPMPSPGGVACQLRPCSRPARADRSMHLLLCLRGFEFVRMRALFDSGRSFALRFLLLGPARNIAAGSPLPFLHLNFPLWTSSGLVIQTSQWSSHDSVNYSHKMFEQIFMQFLCNNLVLQPLWVKIFSNSLQFQNTYGYPETIMHIQSELWE